MNSIYIVDSYLLTRLTLRRYFDKCKNYTVAGDFSHLIFCIEEMKKNPADIIIINSNLTDDTELNKIEELKQNFPATKVILKTSQKNRELILNALSSGISGFISNDDTDLIEVIDTVVKGSFLIDIDIATNIFSILKKLNLENIKIIKERNEVKSSLTQRELEVLKLITQGKTNSQIAREIIISTNTAKAHVGNILSKLSVTDRVQAAVKAVKMRMF